MSAPELPQGEAKPPWEQPGSCRRDCEPHRGFELHVLAVTSLVCGVLSLCLLLPAVLGLPLSFVACSLIERDLEQMAKGFMDPEGEDLTTKAQNLAFASLSLNVIGLCLLICNLVQSFL